MITGTNEIYIYIYICILQFVHLRRDIFETKHFINLFVKTHPQNQPT